MSQAQASKHSASKQITLDEAKEILKDLNITPDTAVTFKPLFLETVEVIGPSGAQEVNQFYCLTSPSALQLMMVLGDLNPVGYLDDPQKFSSGSTFFYSRRVPWLKFGDGTIRNAGQLAQFWVGNNGDPNGKTAETMARQDIAWGN